MRVLDIMALAFGLAVVGYLALSIRYPDWFP
jgi:hypothetical protein